MGSRIQRNIDRDGWPQPNWFNKRNKQNSTEEKFIPEKIKRPAKEI